MIIIPRSIQPGFLSHCEWNSKLGRLLHLHHLVIIIACITVIAVAVSLEMSIIKLSEKLYNYKTSPPIYVAISCQPKCLSYYSNVALMMIKKIMIIVVRTMKKLKPLVRMTSIIEQVSCQTLSQSVS